LIDVSLRVLRYFVAAADHGNVTLAARMLNVSQPSISLAIAQLEKALKVQVFVRQHSRGVALTPAGTEVLREVRKLLSHVDDFAANVAAVGNELRGTLSIGCLAYLVPRYLAAILSAFSARYPQIDVSLREGDQSDLVRGLMNGQLEAVLTYDVLLPRQFSMEVLLELPPYVLVSANHHFARRKAISLRSIVEEPCVLLDLPVSREYFASVFGALGLSPNVRYHSTSVEAVRSFVSNGLGYSVLNHRLKTFVTYDGGKVATLELTDNLPPARIASVHLQGSRLRPVAQAFLAFARDFFSRQPAGS
jgi:DNA-binding transcriptional LysR family regulator